MLFVWGRDGMSLHGRESGKGVMDLRQGPRRAEHGVAVGTVF